MPINLTTPWDAGSADDGAEYPQAKIVKFEMGLTAPKHIKIFVEFGDTVDGEWASGATGAFEISLEDGPGVADYTDFVAANQTLFDDVADVLYAKVQALRSDTAGEIA